MKNYAMEPILSPLGKTVTYTDTYNSGLLFPIPRQTKRTEIGISEPLPFYGKDIWHSYEVSWLNLKGKPEVAIAEFSFSCESPLLIESKSFKLYLNSLNQSRFASVATVQQILTADLSAATNSLVEVTLNLTKDLQQPLISRFSGICLDELDITCETYSVEPRFLSCGATLVTETLYSDLLKSNCLVTGQPDWGSVQINYTGPQINHEGLLRYFVSFRNHNEFHEQCVERIFIDIMSYCSPHHLSVFACYTRRGGLDINPFRSSAPELPPGLRLVRQ